MAARPPDVERHTGMDFEAGHVHRARNVEEQPPGGMITGGERVTVPGASPDPGGAVSPARSTRASAGERSAEPSPRDERAAARTANRRAEDDLAAILRKPWRGQAESVKGVQKKVLAQFEEKGLRKKKMEDGVQIDYAVTKYWVKYDGEDAAEETTRLNITRMFAKLLKSKKCPDEIYLYLMLLSLLRSSQGRSNVLSRMRTAWATCWLRRSRGSNSPASRQHSGSP